LETAELALAEQAPAKRNIEEGEMTAPTSKLPPKKKAKKEEKTPFYCKLHGSGQGHNAIGCKVINGQIDKLKAVREGRQPHSQNSGNNNQQSQPKSNWTDCKRPLCELNNQLTSYPNQTGVLPEDELKSAFINTCLPE
jgi:hypothetical protein